VSFESVWPWVVLLLLGAFHGINPGMGWLFAVALGLQEQRLHAVFRALLPIALGHAISIAAVLLLVGMIQVILPERLLHLLSAAVLFGFGLYKLIRARHPRWVGMRVDFKDLTLWSFLMATAHGAGLMLVPVLLQWPAQDYAHAQLIQKLSPNLITTSLGLLLAAVAVHTLSMLLVTAAIAGLVYEKLGLAILRQAWFNLDWVWAGTLILTGLFVMML
jgi:hypothetical protein